MAVELQSLFWTTHIDTDGSFLLTALKVLLWTPFGITLVLMRLIGSIVILTAMLAFHLALPNAMLPLWVRKLLLLFIGIRIRYDHSKLPQVKHYSC